MEGDGVAGLTIVRIFHQHGPLYYSLSISSDDPLVEVWRNAACAEEPVLMNVGFVYEYEEGSKRPVFAETDIDPETEEPKTALGRIFYAELFPEEGVDAEYRVVLGSTLPLNHRP